MTLHLALSLAAALASSGRPSLWGTVTAADGEPLANALVVIYTAKPKVGTSATCPSCYADCAKSTTTNERGEFEIRSLDPSLLFRVGGLAAFHEARFVADVNPAASPITIALPPRSPLPDDPARVVCGRLVDPEGAPVVGAIVVPRGFEVAQSNGVVKTFGSLDPTISGPDGAFVLVLPRPAAAAFVLLEARGLARAEPRIVTGLEEKTLTLERGAAVRARVVRNGAPVDGVTMGLVQSSHNAETFLGEYTAVTDQAGRVLLGNVCPNERLVFYGKMQGFSKGVFVAARRIETQGAGSVVDLGDIEVEPGLSLEGRVVLADGKAVPAGTEVGVYRDEPWDWIQTRTGAGGTFAFDGLPREVVSVLADLPGYRTSPKNASYVVPRGGLTGRLDTDTRLLILLEPEPVPPLVHLRETAEDWKAYEKRKEEVSARPLSGVSESMLDTN